MSFLITLIFIVVIVVIFAQFVSHKKTLVDPSILDQEIKSARSKLDDHLLESIKITPVVKAVRDISSSKFGGYPYWPSDLEYPKDKEGSPLRLLAQINLLDLPFNTILPKTGLLQFYISDYGSFGIDDSPNLSIDEVIANPSGYSVIYHSEAEGDVLTDISKLYPIREKSEFPFDDEYSLMFEKEKMVASPLDYRFEKIIGSLEEYHEQTVDQFYEIFETGGSRLGGYASFTQEDPRLIKSNEEWLLLFQLDTYCKKGVNIMWGDSGIGNFFIRPKDLEKCDFSEVWFSWDCC